ncbi:hypothetical protein F442_17234, partial [Phytophthora nicotianae P10297]
PSPGTSNRDKQASVTSKVMEQRVAVARGFNAVYKLWG